MTRKVGGREATTGVIPGEYCLSVGNPGTETPQGWTWKPLSQLARLESGHTPSRRKPEYWGGDVSWIGIKDATGNHGRLIYDTIQHTNAKGIANSAARILPENTVCLSRTASVGYVVVMGRPMATSQDFANWVCGPDLDHRYLKYALLLENASLKRFSYGSTHQTIYYPELKAFHICAPDLAEQREIASTLGALDDKIELNRKTAATLEEMARALYRSWFVDFDPVRARAEGRAPAHMDPTTAALFPDSFDEDGLPVGWKNGQLGDLALLSPTAHSRKAHPSRLEYVDLSNTKWGQIEATTCYDWNAAPSRARLILEVGDTIVGTVRPANGSYAYIGNDGLTGSTGFAVLRPRDAIDRALVYVAATDPATIEDLANLADGGAYPAVRPDVVSSRPVCMSPKDIRIAFSEMTAPFIDKMGALKIENRSLATLRDTLLPRLMSGELRLGAAHEMIEKIA